MVGGTHGPSKDRVGHGARRTRGGRTGPRCNAPKFAVPLRAPGRTARDGRRGPGAAGGGGVFAHLLSHVGTQRSSTIHTWVACQGNWGEMCADDKYSSSFMGLVPADREGGWPTPPTARHPPPPHRPATSVCRLRDDQMGQGPTEPHAGRSTFLLSSGGAGGRVLLSGR